MTTVLQPRPVSSTPAPWSFPSFETSMLPNGLRLVHRRVPGQPLVAVSLVIAAPVTGEPAGLAGISRTVAGSLTQGADGLSDSEFAAALESTGASLSVAADPLGLTVALDVPVSRLESAFALLTSAVTAPTLSDATVARVLGQQLAQFKNSLAQTAWLVERVLQRSLFEGHRLADGVVGSLATMEAITPDAVRAYAGAILRPGAATIVVAGDLPADDLVALVGRTLGGWTGASEPAAALEVPAFARAAIVLADKPGAVQTELRLVGPGPLRGDAGWEADLLAGYILGGALTSRLSMRLREEKGYTYGIASGIIAGGPLSQRRISTSVETGVTAAALDDIFELTTVFADEGPTEAELAQAVTAKVAVAPLRLQTARDLVQELLVPVRDGLPDGWAEGQYARLAAVTLEQAADAARSWAARPWTLAVCGDAEKVLPQLEKFGTVSVTLP